MKKILLVTYSLTDGGGTKRVRLIKQILEDNGMEASIVSFLDFSQGKKLSLITAVKFLLYLYKLIKNENYSTIVCCNSRSFMPVCKAISMVSEVRYINLVQIVYENHFFLLKYFYADKIISVSKAVSDYLIQKQGLKKESITLIRNSNPSLTPITEEEVGKVKENLSLRNTFVISCIARYDPVKGHTYLLQAFEELQKKYPDIRLLLMGYGDYYETIVQDINDLKLSENVVFVKSTHPVNEIMMISDLLVLPSLREGLPTMIIEAFSLGKTVIASDIPGTNEIVRHKYNGLLCQVKDSKSLKENMELLYENGELKKELEKNALATYRNEFSFNQYKLQIVDIFQSV